jgi:hypothetical protein
MKLSYNSHRGRFHNKRISSRLWIVKRHQDPVIPRKWLPELGSNLGALLITNDLASVGVPFNADCLANSMQGCPQAF